MFDGDLTFRLPDGTSAVVGGTLTLWWGFGQGMHWNVHDDGRDGALYDIWPRSSEGRHAAELSVSFDGLEVVGDAYRLTARSGFLNRMSARSPGPMTRLAAHWVNMHDIFRSSALSDEAGNSWSGRWVTEAAGWRIVLDQVAPAEREPTPYQLTHVMEASRVDGSAFDPSEADGLLEWLQYAVSFAVGRWVCPAVGIGFAENGHPRWVDWSRLHCDEIDAGLGWWWKQNDEDLAQMLGLFGAAWADATGRGSLRFATTSAIVASNGTYLETRLTTATAALEHLSWLDEVVHDGQPELKWRSWKAAKRLRRQLRRASIDPHDYAHTPDLASFAAERKLHDAAAAVAEARNELVHPKDGMARLYADDLLGDAARLATDYLSLLILRRLGYGGQVRLRTRMTGWEGETVAVPWA